jgi:hypothetical protein
VDDSTKLDLIGWELLKISKQLEEIVMGQADINTDQQAILTAVANLGAAVTAVQAEITALQGQGVDTTGLDSAVAQLGTAVTAVQALAPAPASGTGTPAATT